MMAVGHGDCNHDYGDNDSYNDSGNTLQPLIAIVMLIVIVFGTLQPLSS